LRAVAIQTNNAMNSTNNQQHEENSTPVEFTSNELTVGTVNPDPFPYFPQLNNTITSLFANTTSDDVTASTNDNSTNNSNPVSDIEMMVKCILFGVLVWMACFNLYIII
jgi:hypothetical protein